MTDGCPLLTYRTEYGDRQFDVPRAFCTATDEFVQPMRADVCNDRFDLHHAAHCEIYREHGGTDPARGGSDTGASDTGSLDTGPTDPEGRDG